MKTFSLTTAAALGLLVTTALPATGQAAFQYAVGEGPSTANLVVDFRSVPDGPGNAFGFSYSWDPATEDTRLTGADLVERIADGGPLGLVLETFSFGEFVVGFTYGDDSFVGDDTSFMGYWADGGTFDNFNTGMEEAFAAGAFTYSETAGASSRFLADGTVDGYAPALFENGVTTRGSAPASFVVPEPAAASLLVGGLLLGVRRRRDAR